MRKLVYAALAAIPSLTLGTGLSASDRVYVSDLAGSWHGLYTYSRQGARPVEFTVTIQVDDSICRGRTEEPNTFGNTAAPRLFANFNCQLITGRGAPRLVFRKTYDGTGGQSHSVDYDGEIASDRAGITGTWRLGTESGRFSLLKQ